jgi:hypothetical protein
MNSEIQVYLTMWKEVAGNTLNIRYNFITDRRIAGSSFLPAAGWLTAWASGYTCPHS